MRDLYSVSFLVTLAEAEIVVEQCLQNSNIKYIPAKNSEPLIAYSSTLKKKFRTLQLSNFKKYVFCDVFLGIHFPKRGKQKSRKYWCLDKGDTMKMQHNVFPRRQ